MLQRFELYTSLGPFLGADCPRQNSEVIFSLSLWVSFVSPQTHPPRHAVLWSGGPVQDLVRLVALDGQPLVSRHSVPELVLGLDGGPAVDLGAAVLGREIEVLGHQGQGDFRLDHGEFLADAVPGPLFERPPRVLARGRVQLGAGVGGQRRQEPLGHEPDRVREVVGVPVDHGRDRPHVEALEGVVPARLGVVDVPVLGRRDVLGPQQLPERAGRREEAEDLPDHRRHVLQSVDRVGVGFDLVGDLFRGDGIAAAAAVGAGAAVDGVQLGDEPGVDLRVQVQQVHGVRDGGGRGVVAGKDEGLDRVDGQCPKGRVHGPRGRRLVVRGFIVVSVEGEFDDGAFAVFESLLLRRGGGAVAGGVCCCCCCRVACRDPLVNFGAQESVQLAHVQPHLHIALEVDVVQG